MTTAPLTEAEPVAAATGGDGRVRLRLDLGYDGYRFSGWARQPGMRTVQETVEDALGTVLRLGCPVALTVAGRTDAGVHARGQVAHVDVPTSSVAGFALLTNSKRLADPSPPAESAAPAGGLYPTVAVGEPSPLSPGEQSKHGAGGRDLARSLNGVLPDDVRIYRVTIAPPGFDARFSALSRRYAYRVSDDPVAYDPMRRHDVLWHKRPLDLTAMNTAAAALLGVHDFAAFCRKRASATTIRNLHGVIWDRAERGLAVATVEADAFCHSMVRALVGALLAVGDGRRPVAWPAAVLASGARDPSAPVVSPHGLTLEEVRYPATPEAMAARAVETRRPRA